ncbi:teichoic acids export ABC transporter ATP-binding subunit TagH [Bacillus sp. LL01]|uniref:teichoic acids export ABC transporter ATP-binding subunit TagH n=1 Tax=Bacillus sp. LL01 TaxID=1665556 RepID=UPI0009E502CD|nr:teichoic acids export ABC transporter ATP-binding subunit TagH [Bacillus sp. LL01]
MKHSVVFQSVTKKYKMYNKSFEKLLDIFTPKGFGEDFYALQNIDFVANAGDVIGVIGVNGAGKSTLSNLITGVIPPTYGNIKICGKASLIAISSGLNNQLTGIENIELKCLMLGFSKKQIDELIPEIIEFAELGKFIDQPVKSYSSGMKSRLGFAISVNIDPDVLVIDEALSVGDQAFADKCLAKMNEFKEKGKTIFFISHSLGQVKQFCQKALWLEAGEVKAYGDINEIAPKYEAFLKEFKSMSKEDQKAFKKNIMLKREKLNQPLSSLNEYTGRQSNFHEGRISDRKNNKSKFTLNKWFLLGLLSTIAAVLVIFFLSGNENVSKIVEEEVVNENSEKPLANSITPTQVQMNGVITTEVAPVYFDENLEYKLIDAIFSTVVFIDSEINGTYKIEIDNQTGYINKENIEILEESKETTLFSLQTFTSLYPEQFSSSYEYYFAFLGSEKHEIENIFSDSTVTIDANGLEYLEYPYANVRYKFNENNVADTLLINDILIESALIQELQSEAKYLSPNGQVMFYELQDDRVLILNMREKTLEFKLNNRD